MLYELNSMKPYPLTPCFCCIQCWFISPQLSSFMRWFGHLLTESLAKSEGILIMWCCRPGCPSGLFPWSLFGWCYVAPFRLILYSCVEVESNTESSDANMCGLTTACTILYPSLWWYGRCLKVMQERGSDQIKFTQQACQSTEEESRGTYKKSNKNNIFLPFVAPQFYCAVLLLKA